MTRRQALASQLADSEIAHGTALQALETSRQDLEGRLAAAQDARQLLENQHASAMAAAREALANSEQRAERLQSDATAMARALEARLVESGRHAETLRAQLSEALALHQQTEQRSTTELAAADARFHTLKHDSDARLAEALASAGSLRSLADTLQEDLGTLRGEADALRAEGTGLRKETEDLRGAAAGLQKEAERLREELSATRATLTRAEAEGATDRQKASEEATRRQAEFEDTLARETANRKTLEAQLAEEQAARQRDEQRHVSAVSQAAARLTDHQQQADARAAQAASALGALQAKLVEQAATLLETERKANADRHASAEQFAQRQARFDTELAQEVARRQNVSARLTEAEAAQQKAASEHSAALASAREQLTRQQLEAESRQSEFGVAVQQFEVRLADTASLLHDSETRAVAERQAAVDQAAKQRSEFEAALASEAANTQAALQQVAERDAAMQLADERHQAALVAARQQFESAQQQSEAKLAEAAAATAKVETQLADTTAALKRAHEQAARDRQTAAQETAERRAEFETAFANEVGVRQTLETQLFEERGQRQKAEAQFAADIATAREQFSAYQQKSELRFAETQQQHTSAIGVAEARLVQQQREAEAALSQHRQRAEQQLTEEKQRAETRLSELRKQSDAELKQQRQDAEATLGSHKQQAETRLAEVTANAAATLEAALQRAASERQAAADRFAQQQAALEASLAHEIARRESVDAALADLQKASAEAERRFVDGIAAMRQQAAEHDAMLQERAAKERSEWEATLADRHQRIGQLEMDGEQARQSITASQAKIQQLEAANADGRAKLAALQQAFDQAKVSAQQSIEALSRSHADERMRLQGTVAERDRQLHEQATRYHVANEAAAKAMAEVEKRLAGALETGRQDAQAITHLEQQLAGFRRDLEALNQQRDQLKTEADRVPVLRKLLDETHTEHRHRFDQLPIGMWRCSRDGAIVQANQALVSLLRYKTTDELLDVNFSTSVFESPDELQWLVDRCLASNTTETVETTWRRNDGVGIVVRLMAIATAPEAVDFVAIDITTLRTLEEKLRNSQRMEAVARYASEVAVTCDKLLGQVNQQGQQWLNRIESDSARQQGALLLDDVTRAAGFLRQLTVYGKEEKNAPDLVDVKEVLRDLEPVLKRVAGGHVELVMPKTSTPYNLDVEMERFERILVNVAAYGRERMPFGGRLMIEVSAAVIERTFVEKYPNVRPGAHVLLTVTEVKGASMPDWSTGFRDQASSGNGGASQTLKPGVDLGALQALVGDCGGHLWIMAEPSGNMELRIHLPRRVLDDRSPAKKTVRSRLMSKLAGARG